MNSEVYVLLQLQKSVFKRGKYTLTIGDHSKTIIFAILAHNTVYRQMQF